MNFKVISFEQIKGIYPNNYDIETLKKFYLYGEDFNNNYKNCYSFYRYYLEMFLSNFLNLKEIEEKVNEFNIGVDVSNLYKDISNFGFSYVYLRNNVFLDRLTFEEFEVFKNAYITNDKEKTLEIVKNTYKRLVMFDYNIDVNNVVNYDPVYGGLLTQNNSIIFEVLAKKDNGFLNFIKKKEQEYTDLLGVPVSILVKNVENVLSEEVSVSVNLNGEEDKKDEFVLKKYSKYLPIGSVVMLKGGWKKVMILGFSQMDVVKKDKIFDYVGCMYPEGVVFNNYNILFNHEDIKKLYALGLVDEEEKAFKEKIWEIIDNK